MKHESYVEGCGICANNAGSAPILFENRLWLIRPGAGVPGWMILHSQRHVPGIAHFNDEEVQSLGPTLRHLEMLLEDVTGALRIYTCSMNESSPHFHCHMVPRYAKMHEDVSGFDVFGLLRASPERREAETAETERLRQVYRESLEKSPPPEPISTRR